MRIPITTGRLVLLAAIGSAMGPVAAARVPGAGEPAGGVPRGQVVERIECGSDPEQTYALYLPAAYDRAARWPLLILMDPRGRARVPLDRVREPAERLGYIVASSYNTMSDGPPEPNQAALAAMVRDTDRRFSIDPARTYLVGFSGTARIAWIFAYRMSGRVAGVIGFGAGLPQTLLPFEGVAADLGTPFAFFGGAGGLDFNYDEVRRLDRTLDGIGLVHRMEFYEGPHAWPPAAVFADAVDWMELQAMKSGLRPPRPDWIEAEFRRRLAGAEAAEKEGDSLLAWERFRQTAADFDGLRDVATVKSRAAALAESKRVRRARRRADTLERDYLKWVGRLRDFIRDYAEAEPLPQTADAMYDLQIGSLQRRAAREPDRPAGLSARRRLALAFVETSFYLPREYLNAGDAGRAEGMLRIAAAIRPGDPGVCLQLARALAQLGRTDEVLDNLRCAIGSGRIEADAIEADELLEPVRSEAGYRDLIEELKKEREPSGTESDRGGGRGAT